MMSSQQGDDIDDKERQGDDKKRVGDDNEDSATGIWHKLIPGTAITLQVALDSALRSAFSSSAQCSGVNEFGWRTAAFIITAIVGLATMKWTFKTGDKQRQFFHRVINVFLVFAWLIAISDFPVTCWIATDGMLSSDQVQSVGLLRLLILALTQAVSALEISKPRRLAGTPAFLN
jgi:hypothetical protein